MQKGAGYLAGLFAVGVLCSGTAFAIKAPPPMNPSIANQLVQAYGAKKGLRGLRLNEFRQARVALKFKRVNNGPGPGKIGVSPAGSGAMRGGNSPMGTICFSMVNADEMRAYISIFREPMVSTRRDSYFDRINSQIHGQNTGGAQMVFVSEAKTYYLAKTYRASVPVGVFLSEVAAMEQAAGKWTLGIVPKLEIAAKRRLRVPAQRGIKIAYWRLE